MPRLSFQLRTISPLFLAGADSQGEPELRAASIRGQLRYWLRAVHGADVSGLDSVWKREAAVFGATDRGSVVSIRFTSDETIVPQNAPMLPHRLVTGKNPLKRRAIPRGTICKLALVTRPGQALPDDFVKALSTWLLLGGVGKRSRRTFGAFAIDDVDVTPGVRVDRANRWWATPPQTPDDLIKAIHAHFQWLYPAGTTFAPVSGIPDYPTLHPQHSRIVVCKRRFASAQEANQRLFNDLLRSNTHPYVQPQHKVMFGYATAGRRASPVLAQVRQTGRAYALILTAMRSPLKRSHELPATWQPDWTVVNQFLDEAETLFHGETVWGGPFL